MREGFEWHGDGRKCVAEDGSLALWMFMMMRDAQIYVVQHTIQYLSIEIAQMNVDQIDLQYRNRAV